MDPLIAGGSIHTRSWNPPTVRGILDLNPLSCLRVCRRPDNSRLGPHPAKPRRLPRQRTGLYIRPAMFNDAGRRVLNAPPIR